MTSSPVLCDECGKGPAEENTGYGTLCEACVAEQVALSKATSQEENAERAARAQAALERYIITGSGDAVTDIADLICDLLHLAKRSGSWATPEWVFNQALMHFEAEEIEEKEGKAAAWNRP